MEDDDWVEASFRAISKTRDEIELTCDKVTIVKEEIKRDDVMMQ
jgi:hypothetical protein